MRSHGGAWHDAQLARIRRVSGARECRAAYSVRIRPPGVVLPFPWDSAPGFNKQPTVINGFTDLIVDVFGVDIGAHARSAVGMAELPFDIPVEIEGEVAISQ